MAPVNEVEGEVARLMLLGGSCQTLDAYANERSYQQVAKVQGVESRWTIVLIDTLQKTRPLSDAKRILANEQLSQG